MDQKDIEAVLKNITYKGKKDFCELTRLNLENYNKKPDSDSWSTHAAYDLRVYIPIKDRITGEETRLYRRYVFMPNELAMLTPSLIVKRVRELIVQVEVHEIDEQIVYMNERVFDPHVTLSGPDIDEQAKEHYEQAERDKEKMIKLKKDIVEQLNLKKDDMKEVV